MKGFVPGLALALAFGPATLGPPSAAAQEVSLLQGLVAEAETGRVIPSATVTLMGAGIETRSGPDGTFEFFAPPIGRVLLRVRAAGYPAVVEEVDVTPGALFVPVFLPSAAAVLEELLVTGTRSDDLEKKAAKTAADLLALQIPQIVPLVSQAGAPPTRSNNRGRLELRGRGTFSLSGEPAIVLDGARMTGGIGSAMDRLRQIPASQVKEIRVLKGLSSAFLYGSPDGVIYIQTQSGAPRP